MNDDAPTRGRNVSRRSVCFSAVLAVVSCVLLLTGCQASVPTDSELLGQWHSVKDGGSITFASEGVCAISGMPNYVLASLRDETPGEYNGACTWAIGDTRIGPRDGDGSPIVSIDFDLSEKPSAYGINLKVRGSRDNRTLYYTLGDPDSDDYYELTRVFR